ncbi:frizzled-4 [Eupeodes corollae]|uniref:frizzled-4 n=1 Tax=Eupeodes corollae TaxID=290404 RepID=UPI00249269C1|nr:frizzled-4 [Eupeodes corollae]
MTKLHAALWTLLLMLAGAGKLADADLVPRVCEPIRIELCRGIGYNETSMPNMVGHELQTDVDFTLQTFAPLIEYVCSTQLKLFLCAAYVPMCTPKVPVPIGPCRSLCESVRTRCHPVLQGFGFPWPPALDCNRFPKENNHEHMCMEGPGEIGIGMAPPISKVTSFHQPGCQGLAKSHLYIRLNRSGRCAPLCEADILFDKAEKHLAEMWVTTWSYAALGIAVVATLCLILSDTKWDRILTPLVTCHSLVAIGWTVRFVSGRNTTACGFDPQLPNVSLLLIDGLSNASCAATFLLRYYFGMSASVWWSILCLEWHRGVRQTRNEFCEPANVSGLIGGINCQRTIPKPTTKTLRRNQDTYSNIAQVAAWGLPALQTVAVLVTRLVDADELLGACFVGNQSDRGLRVLVATPLFCYWIFGSVNLFAGYLVHRRNGPLATVYGQPPPPINTKYQKAVHMKGVGTFLFIYCIPCALLLIAVFYEFANSDVWLNLPAPTYVPVAAVKAPMWPFMTRAFMELMIGVVSSAWVLGPRIANMYKNQMTPKCKHTPTKYPPTTAYSTASYQTVRQSSASTAISMDKISRYSSARKYPTTHMPRHGSSRVGYKMPPQAFGHYGNETIL